MTSEIQLNLTRKWRSKTFDEIVGQKLPVRLLKNSLYRGKLFPVYLLSGLRGSGKTSTGRILAAAVNCRKLEEFQKNPKDCPLPCQACDSCLAMKIGSHPDFIEIDAASHTGVDNVRQIIESSSFLPSLGVKKIYLIDEAHMLSKAAFNAFLKILEEPPATVLFLLATTDPQKILPTVKSRSFQLFFDPIHADDLIPHLAHVCKTEGIECSDDALHVVVQESEGSARDAINLIERVRLTEGRVTKESVSRALGAVNDQAMIELFQVIAQGSLQGMLEQLQKMDVERHSAQMVWKKMVDFVRALVWAHHDIPLSTYSAHYKEIKALVPYYSLPVVTGFLDLLYKTEAQFLRTSARHALIESMLCKMVQKFGGVAVSTPVLVRSAKSSEALVKGDQKPQAQEPVKPSEALAKDGPEASTPWDQFMQEIAQQSNPLVGSIFQQGTMVEHAGDNLKIKFPKKFEFYNEWLSGNEMLWYPLLEKAFGKGVKFESEFTAEDPVPNSSGFHQSKASAPKKTVQAVAQASSSQKKTATMTSRKTGVAKKEKIDVSDKDKWQKANELLGVFPGTVSSIKE